MSEINTDIPFLWRLELQDDGWCAVTMIVPINKHGDIVEHAIPTSVLCLLDESMPESDELLEWSEEDVSLFLALISKASRSHRKNNGAVKRSGSKLGVLRVDLSEPETIKAVQVVAAASFGVVFDGDDYLVGHESSLPSADCAVGSEVSISTVTGFKSCIVVDEDDESLVCVLLDKVDSGVPGYIEDINPYDLLLLKRHQVLQSQYSSLTPGKSDTLH